MANVAASETSKALAVDTKDHYIESRVFMKAATITLLLALAIASCGRGTTWTTPTGLQITELVEGEGPLAGKGDGMFMLYTASFVGGRVFDKQLDPEAPFVYRLDVDSILPGLAEGVRTMRQGSKRILVMPPEIAFGKEGLPGTVPPDTWVRFEVELLEIRAAPPMPEPWNDAGMEIFTAPSGLQIVDFVIGEGEAPKPTSYVAVHYSAFLDDGTCFDTTYLKGMPIEFQLSEKRLIAGWREGLLSMRVGGKRKLIIPPYLGYGEKGYGKTIPPNATLIYDIELIQVRDK
jgi:peptidylprolyl isomerase